MPDKHATQVARAVRMSLRKGARVRQTRKNTTPSRITAISGARTRTPAGLSVGAAPCAEDLARKPGNTPNTRRSAGPTKAATDAAARDARTTTPAARKRLLRLAVPVTAAMATPAAAPPATSQPITAASQPDFRPRPQAAAPIRSAKAAPPVAATNTSKPVVRIMHARRAQMRTCPSKAARAPSTRPTTTPASTAARKTTTENFGVGNVPGLKAQPALQASC